MTLQESLHPDSIIELKSRQKNDAINELITSLHARHPSVDKALVLTRIQEKETLFSSVIRDGVAIPHVRVEMHEPVLVAIGRSERGVDFLGDNRPSVRLVVLLLTRPDRPDAHLDILKDLATILDNDVILTSLITAPGIDDIRRMLVGRTSSKATIPAKPRASKIDEQITDVVLKHSGEMARSLGVKTIFVNCDTISHPERLKPLFGAKSSRNRVIAVFKESAVTEEFTRAFSENILQLPEMDLTNVGQIKLALFLALTKRWIKRSDTIIYLLPGSAIRGVSNIDIIAIRERFSDIIFVQPERFRTVLEPSVLQQLIKIAFDLAINGREGHKVGTLFIAGDHTAVVPHTQQLIVNPFRSSTEDERYNILDPAIEEMVKELAQIDGAFVIAKDGRIISAGAYIGTGRRKAEITKGLGARHQAAANITAVTRSVAVTVSETKGVVTVFQNGHTVFIIEPVAKKIRVRAGEKGTIRRTRKT
jgi:DNA integrity scanning protein DisA with diadenylate cyclase activity/mannitol/fructose-specific phosphotransferase system IIA component (Ntr-type)